MVGKGVGWADRYGGVGRVLVYCDVSGCPNGTTYIE